MEQIQYTKKVPVRYKADVAVIGGGIAGVCAAAAAAKSGASVILVERFAACGGMMTVGGVNNFCGESRGQGDVFDEIVAGLEAFNAISPYTPYRHFEAGNRKFEHEILMVVLQELLLKRGVRLLLHTRFVDTVVDEGKIKACVIRGQSGPEAVAADQFVDCTGEADVARLAGCETMKGRGKDGLQLPMSMMFFVRHLPPEKAVPQVPPGWFERFEAADELPMVTPWPNGPGSNAIKMKVTGHDSTDTEGLTAAELEGRRKMMGVLDYYQRAEKKPWHYDHCSPIIGIREGRRIVGDYVLTEDDVRAGRAFDDGVAVGTFYLDAHDPTTDKRVAQITNRQDRKVPPYQIPLRCLYARDCTNLWMAGRCLSADALAMSSARVATSGAMMGQAVGIASAQAVEKECMPREVDPASVRAIVEKRGGHLTTGDKK